MGLKEIEVAKGESSRLIAETRVQTELRKSHRNCTKSLLIRPGSSRLQRKKEQVDRLTFTSSN